MGLFSSTTPEQKAERRRQEQEADLALAAHEVGHAIGCAAARIEVRHVRLSGGSGQVSHADVDLDDPAEVDGALVMTLAGWAAGAEWAHRHHGMSRSAALSWSRAGARKDWAEFRRMKRHGSHSGGWYERAAQKLVRANWSRIERYTRELVRTGQLPGSRFN
ncbi:hypothetical protein [Amycolatopsis rifamycinica]|uniref:Peptidase M41 domain-containing protein n=1 Tax=Amycolatopsis rifamycinica TaxID=287986 RepID=A0A066UBJ5_9PSEU|nr:hypothetical protein [Amycolatopsis rifamycinica]KDN23212.1 hypothetical protein DV20_05705 [Amycolatopsis rifamycinica]